MTFCSSKAVTQKLIPCKNFEILITWGYSTDIQGRFRNLHHLYPGMGLKLGIFRFSRNRNNRGSSDAYVTCIYWGLSMKITMRKTWHVAQRSWTHLLCFVFLCVVSKNPKTPNSCPMADDAITLGRIKRSGISLVYLWVTKWCRWLVSTVHQWITPIGIYILLFV